MIIVYVSRLGGKNADVSYNTAWQGLWAFAEISLGIIVTCTFSLPKFIEAKGTKLRGIFSSLKRSFTSLTSGGSFRAFIQPKKNITTSQEVTLDSVTMIGHSKSDLPFTSHDQDMERDPSYESVHTPRSTQASIPRIHHTGSEADDADLRNCGVAASFPRLPYS